MSARAGGYYRNSRSAGRGTPRTRRSARHAQGAGWRHGPRACSWRAKRMGASDLPAARGAFALAPVVPRRTLLVDDRLDVALARVRMACIFGQDDLPLRDALRIRASQPFESLVCRRTTWRRRRPLRATEPTTSVCGPIFATQSKGRRRATGRAGPAARGVRGRITPCGRHWWDHVSDRRRGGRDWGQRRSSHRSHRPGPRSCGCRQARC